MITPFTEKEELDEALIRRVVDDLIGFGVHGIMCCGSTGESGALLREERRRVIEWTVDQVKGRVPVVAGTGSSGTKETIEATMDAKDVGADAALIITPYYQIGTDEGVYEHYREVARKVDIPIIPYNVPQATLFNLSPSLLARLVKDIGNIVGVKESSGSTGQLAENISLVGERISVLTGNDVGLLPDFILGCPGAIVAIGNVAPRIVVEIFGSVQKGDMRRAREAYYQLLPVALALDGEANWAARVKEMVRLQGRVAGMVRKPYLPIGDEEREKLSEALKNAKLI
jgi:4-hydroxy-tetrahydrodipicolinate synthase